jgi:hypothetical protein
MLNLIIAWLVSSIVSTRAQSLPDVEPPRLARFLTALQHEAVDDVPTSLVVYLAWAESRFDPDAKPGCGVLQVFPRDIYQPPSRCKLWRSDQRLAIRAGVRELRMLMSEPRVHGDLWIALMYRACGNVYFDGACDAAKSRWVEFALRGAWMLNPLSLDVATALLRASLEKVRES